MSRFDPSVLLQAFSTLTLDLHRLAQDQDIDNFHGHALERISELLPFDAAWWARAAVINGLPEEHSTYLYNLPSTYLADWQSIRHVDVAVARTQKMRQPGGDRGHARSSQWRRPELAW